MKSKIRKATHYTYTDVITNPINYNNPINNNNKISKNMKMEDISNFNYASQIPLNFEEFNTYIDPNSINPPMLNNKYVSDDLITLIENRLQAYQIIIIKQI